MIKSNYRFLLTGLVSALLYIPYVSMAETHGNCGKDIAVPVHQMGQATESQIMAHADKLEAQLKKTRHSHGRGSRLSRTHDLRRHLSEMQIAMEKLHDKLYIDGCKDAQHGTSLKTRIRVLETRI